MVSWEFIRNHPHAFVAEIETHARSRFSNAVRSQLTIAALRNLERRPISVLSGLNGTTFLHELAQRQQVKLLVPNDHPQNAVLMIPFANQESGIEAETNTPTTSGNNSHIPNGHPVLEANIRVTWQPQIQLDAMDVSRESIENFLKEYIRFALKSDETREDQFSLIYFENRAGKLPLVLTLSVTQDDHSGKVNGVVVKDVEGLPNNRSTQEANFWRRVSLAFGFKAYELNIPPTRNLKWNFTEFNKVAVSARVLAKLHIKHRMTVERLNTLLGQVTTLAARDVDLMSYVRLENQVYAAYFSYVRGDGTLHLTSIHPVDP